MMNQDRKTKKFPKHFFWGASTASHQVEGHTINQWSVWELAHARELAQTAQERLRWLPNWQSIQSQAEDPENYVSGRGVEHYKRYPEDLTVAKKLNLNAFRFGIEWSRLEPEEGVWNEKAIAHYKDYLAELREQGLEPFLNIWHWTMPTWFTDIGGFKKRSNIVYFERFVKKIADEFIDDVHFVITLNEPNVYASFGYGTGEWPPNEKKWLTFVWVYANLVTAHKRAYKILKQAKPNLQVGIAHQLANAQALNPNALFDKVCAKLVRYAWNWWFLRCIRQQQDFVGVNYYFTDYYTGLFKRKNPKTPVNDLGWYMEPAGLYPLLVNTWAKFKKPLYITENGLADAHDTYRQWWLEETLMAMDRALREGVDLRGYFHWSLLDNFEWAYGWWPKFGLVEVDRKTMTRSVRPSARWFAGRIKELSSN